VEGDQHGNDCRESKDDIGCSAVVLCILQRRLAMPVHDWTRVDAGTYHAFHASWNTHLMGALNAGLLPPDHYALAEQVVSRRQTDVLTLQAARVPSTPAAPARAVLEVAPAVRLRLRPPAQKPQPATRRRRRVVIRHITDHRVVAVIEITSPANKDRHDHVREIAGKIVQMLESDIQVLLIDLLPPGEPDPQGIHGAVWQSYDPAGYKPPDEEPLTLASYRWDGTEPELFLEPVGLGRSLVDMPLFLNRERYINVPLEQTYMEAYRDMPAFWRNVLEGAESPS
jgi:hypothetical protein